MQGNHVIRSIPCGIYDSTVGKACWIDHATDTVQKLTDNWQLDGGGMESQSIYGVEF